jgi:hypothetical protein
MIKEFEFSFCAATGFNSDISAPACVLIRSFRNGLDGFHRAQRSVHLDSVCTSVAKDMGSACVINERDAGGCTTGTSDARMGNRKWPTQQTRVLRTFACVPVT